MVAQSGKGEHTPRKVSWESYGAALVISLIVFVAGILVGQSIDNSTVQQMSSDVQKLSSRLESLQLFLLLEGSESSFCPLYKSELAVLDREVEKLGHELTFLENEKNIFDNELKNHYFVLETESMLLSKRVSEKCGSKIMPLLYFYSNKGCEKCVAQGNNILAARDEAIGKYPVRIYSYDCTIGSAVADALMKQYNITSYPSIVINEKVYGGYKSKEGILKIFEEAAASMPTGGI